MAMRDATNRCDFQQAQRINEEVIKGFGDAIAFDRLTACEFVRDYWYAAYYGNNVKQVAAWTKDAAILHRFPDQWPAVLDAKDGPEPSQYPLKLKTYSACLAEQGYETFRGTIWYRQTFPTPTVPPGKKLFLLIAGFDDNLDRVGRRRERSARPRPGPSALPCWKSRASMRRSVSTPLSSASPTRASANSEPAGLLRPVCLIARDTLPAADKSQ